MRIKVAVIRRLLIEKAQIALTELSEIGKMLSDTPTEENGEIIDAIDTAYCNVSDIITRFEKTYYTLGE